MRTSSAPSAVRLILATDDAEDAEEWYLYSIMNGQHRTNIKAGVEVNIILKKDQGSSRLTRGVVKDILTKSFFHPHGIKVRLVSGDVGRVHEVFDATSETP